MLTLDTPRYKGIQVRSGAHDRGTGQPASEIAKELD